MNCLNVGNSLSEDKFCLPKLNEGAVCSTGPVLGALKEENNPNPCAGGLKCSVVGYVLPKGLRVLMAFNNR